MYHTIVHKNGPTTRVFMNKCCVCPLNKVFNETRNFIVLERFVAKQRAIFHFYLIAGVRYNNNIRTEA